MRYRYLFAGTLLLYLVSASGRLAIVDCLVYFQVAKSIALTGWINVNGCVPSAIDNHCVPGIDGKNYSGLGLLPSLVAAPLLRIVYTAFGFGAQSERLAETLASLINPFVSAASVCLFAYWLRRLGFAWTVAFSTSLLFGFATPLWQFSCKGFWSEPLYVLGVMLSVVGGSQGTSPGRILAGTGLGLAILTRTIGVLFAPIFLAYAWANASPTDKRKLRTYAELCAPFMLTLSFVLLTNQLRFGSPWKTGYHTKFPSLERLFPAPFLEGFSGLLIDREVGILWFAPWILLLPWLLRLGWRQHPKELLLVTAFFLGNLLVFAKYSDWAGGMWPIGPRMLLAGSVLPVFALALLLDRLYRDFSLRRWPEVFLCSCCSGRPRPR